MTTPTPTPHIETPAETPERYRARRQSLELTQAALAAMLGLPREAIVRRERGSQRISAEAWIAIRTLRLKARRRKSK